MATLALLASLGCDPGPRAASDRSAVPGGDSSTRATARPPASDAPTSAAGSVAAPADPCVELRKSVVTEAGKLAVCKTDADCVVHPVRLCDFAELDCYAAHVNKAGNTTSLDDAVSAYAKSCPLSKCKCERPAASVCSSGKCVRK